MSRRSRGVCHPKLVLGDGSDLLEADWRREVQTGQFDWSSHEDLQIDRIAYKA